MLACKSDLCEQKAAERCLTISALVVVPVQLIVVRLDKPLASAVASPLHHHCSGTRLNSCPCPNILCNSNQLPIMQCGHKATDGGVRGYLQQLTQMEPLLINALSVPHSLAGNSQQRICCESPLIPLNPGSHD